jgi:ADP-ribose 1''-phosphate phosphatase
VSKVTVIKKSLFDAPPGSLIVHACNTRGMWGSGIAREFALRFPWAHRVYSRHCHQAKEADGTAPSLLGTSLIITEGEHMVGCLFTSASYGSDVDAPEKILDATRRAIADLIRLNDAKCPIALCKINSGLFKVPWDKTMEILNEFNQEFTVYEP